MPVTADKPAPYATSSAILDLIARHRNRGLPSPVTPDVLGRAQVPESLIPRTIQTLQTLDLIDEQGVPTSALEGIRLAPESEYKQRMSEWLKSAYADVLSFVDPAADDETAVRDAFRSYQPVGQQPRMVSLFQGLVTAAGMVAEKQTAHPRRERTHQRTPRTSVGFEDSRSNSGAKKLEDKSSPPPPQPPLVAPISEKALEYRLVDLMAEAADDREVMTSIIKVITFLKTKNATRPAKTEIDAGGEGDR